MKRLLIVISLLLLLVSCESTKPERIVLKSSFTPTPDTLLVAVPENYNSNKSYPLVILLHGWSGNYKQWNDIFSIQDLSNAYNFIIACPDGFYDSWYINNSQKPEIQFEDFFWNDFFPYMNNNYSVDTSNVFITGLSMGGHGATTLYLKNPEFFKGAGSTSGILDLTYFPDRWSIKDGIGSIKDYPEIWENNSAIHLLDSTKHKNANLFIDCGSEDFAYHANVNFVKKCLDIGIDVKFVSIPGTHSRDHWRKMIDKHFSYFNGLL